MKLYLKPSQHSKQAQFMVLASETWPGMLAEARANYHKQKKDVRRRIRRASAHVCCKRSTPRHSRTTVLLYRRVWLFDKCNTWMQ
ncbi:hypothetical protein JG687_00001691 [Phytophthora cactorum]|uniref:Uncharacterized protein n=1 Tax=Phytophthora cactorum TaxID=29920 RepID=A0A8T1V0C5_9STRA|nr:hypothetical protein JG687_00001691 [Phytophthora cactorum]